MTFKLRAGAYRYRALRERHTGWEVLALQHCLIAVGYPCGADGHFGDETDKALRKFQEDFGLVIDGIAGPVSLRILIVTITRAVSEANNLPEHLATGQVEHESSYLPGNYTAPYENGRRDLGVVMLNKEPTEENCRLAFDAPNRIDQLAKFLRTRHDLYWKSGNNRFVTTHERAWQLACGAWNAPAWTDKLSRGESLTAAQKAHIDAYIEDCTVYVREWSP